MKTWESTSVGTLSAFEAHNKGSVVGTRVRLTINYGRKIEGVVTEMGRSEVSSVYYALRIREDGKTLAGLINLPLSHPIEREVDSAQQKPLEAAFKALSVLTEEQRRAKYASLDRIADVIDLCAVCMGEIRVQVFKGTGICSTNCYKEANGEKSVEKAVSP